MNDFQKTFGPVVIEFEDEPNKLVAKCQSGRFDCQGRVGNVCVWNKDEQGKARPLPDDMKTPDWCQYKQSALDDAQEMMRNAIKAKARTPIATNEQNRSGKRQRKSWKPLDTLPE